jgi:TolA-binding protein
MKKILLAIALAAALVGMDLWVLRAAESSNKVPAEIGVRIRNVQLDISRVQTQNLQLQQQYLTNTQTLQHDQGELDDLNKEALAAGKQDPATTTVDDEKLEFVAKPKAPEAKK